MARELEEMPLFPLNTVLFPYAQIHLHIFEERYRDMIRLCIEQDRPFGIVLIRSGEELGEPDPYLVGTAARVREILHTYPDGRMDINVQGERRFRIRELDESLPYLVGRVEPVIEHPIEDQDRAEELLAQAREEAEILIRRHFERQEFNVQIVFPPDPVALSFTIANMLTIDNLEKQRMLETTDTLERVEDLLPLLRSSAFEAPRPSYYRLSAEELREWITPN